jgi:hypothetical protein
MHLVSKSRFPPLVSPQLLACFVIWVQCLGFTRHLSATYCAHLVWISNFLFPPMCLSTSCIHLVSYVGFPPLASPQLLALMLFQCPNFSCTPVPLSNFLHAFGFNILGFPWLSTTSCAHLVSISNFPPWASHQTSQTSCIHWVSISILPP